MIMFMRPRERLSKHTGQVIVVKDMTMLCVIVASCYVKAGAQNTMKA